MNTSNKTTKNIDIFTKLFGRRRLPTPIRKKSVYSCYSGNRKAEDISTLENVTTGSQPMVTEIRETLNMSRSLNLT